MTHHQSSFSQIPIVSDLSQTLNTSLITSVYSLSKLKMNQQSIEKKTISIEKPLFKPKNSKLKEDLIDSTEPSIERPKDLIEIEQKIKKAQNFEDPEEKFKLICEILEKMLVFHNPFNNILSQVKDIIEIIVSSFQEKLKNYNDNEAELNEYKHTLKILKKRFKKLALEILDVKNELIDKENKYIKSKEKCKILELEKKTYEKDREKLLKSFTEELEISQNQLQRVKNKLEKYKKHAFAISDKLSRLKNLKISENEEFLNIVNQSIQIIEEDSIENINFSSLENDQISIIYKSEQDHRKSSSFMTLLQSLNVSNTTDLNFFFDDKKSKTKKHTSNKSVNY